MNCAGILSYPRHIPHITADSFRLAISPAPGWISALFELMPVERFSRLQVCRGFAGEEAVAGQRSA
jgi:hypothetical protein